MRPSGVWGLWPPCLRRAGYPHEPTECPRLQVVVITPYGCSFRASAAWREVRKAGRLLRVMENMHSPKAGLDEASLRDTDKHACGACRCDSPRARMAARFANSPHGDRMRASSNWSSRRQIPVSQIGSRKRRSPRSYRKTAGASGVPSNAP